MQKKFRMMTLFAALVILAACGNGEGNTQSGEEELATLEVAFEVPETASVNEKIDLIATVTYGEEMVTDADEVVFEVWEQDQKDNSIMIESVNNDDGTYTAQTKFDKDGVYELYAHTTARGQHTMPLKTITIGEGTDGSTSDNNDEHHHGEQTEGFAIHFIQPKDAEINTEVELISHLQMNDSPLEDVSVKYKIWNDKTSDTAEQVDAEETTAGEYKAIYQFTESGTHHVQVHVENDEGLQQHQQYEVEIAE